MSGDNRSRRKKLLEKFGGEIPGDLALQKDGEKYKAEIIESIPSQ